eukprot:2572958-Pyramimonas_sp.AAC.1
MSPVLAHLLNPQAFLAAPIAMPCRLCTSSLVKGQPAFASPRWLRRPPPQDRQRQQQQPQVQQCATPAPQSFESRAAL